MCWYKIYTTENALNVTFLIVEFSILINSGYNYHLVNIICKVSLGLTVVSETMKNCKVYVQMNRNGTSSNRLVFLSELKYLYKSRRSYIKDRTFMFS